jgi:hypothetical protein
MMTMTISLFAAETPGTGAASKSEPIYGYRMMDNNERDAYRKRMREAGSEKERQAIRDEHRKLMEARARERGATLPEPRGPRGDGTGAGYGPGGQGKGMGPGGKGQGYGPGGQGKGMGPGYGPGGQGQGKGPGYGKGPAGGKGPGYGPGALGDCPTGQECPGPGAGKGPGPRQ